MVLNPRWFKEHVSLVRMVLEGKIRPITNFVPSTAGASVSSLELILKFAVSLWIYKKHGEKFLYLDKLMLFRLSETQFGHEVYEQRYQIS